MKSFCNRIQNYVYCDKVDPKNVISSACKVFDVDINSCKVDDLQFSSEYSLTVNKQKDFEYYGPGTRKINSLLMWFEVDFPIPFHSDEATRIVLSTAPDQEYTHWKQQILYF